MRAVVRRAWERELVVLVAEDTGDTATEQAYERLVAQARIDGLIVTSASVGSSLPRRVMASGAPCVFAGRGVAGSGRNVRLAEEPVSELAVEHFAALGHRVVGHVTGPVDASDIIERRVTGFLAAAEAAGLEARIGRGSLDEAGGAAAAELLLAAEPSPTAILVTNFNQVFGVIAAIRARSLEIPRDVSVIAADDDPVFDFLAAAADGVPARSRRARHGRGRRAARADGGLAAARRGAELAARADRPRLDRPAAGALSRWPGTAFTSSSARRACTTARARSPACPTTSPGSACARSCWSPTAGCSRPERSTACASSPSRRAWPFTLYTDTAENPTTTNLERDRRALPGAAAATASSGSAAAARSTPRRPPRRCSRTAAACGTTAGATSCRATGRP